MSFKFTEEQLRLLNVMLEKIPPMCKRLAVAEGRGEDNEYVLNLQKVLIKGIVASEYISTLSKSFQEQALRFGKELHTALGEYIKKEDAKGDKRIVYGATCTWWGSVNETDVNDFNIPVCPKCGGTLFEFPDENSWWNKVDEGEKEEPGYRKLIEWLKGKCFVSMDVAKIKFAKEKEENDNFSY